jgi:hypothetical protein
MLSNPKGIYGVHSVVFYDRKTGLPITCARVIKDFNMEFKGEIEDLMGGSNLYAWDGEIKSLSSDVSFTAAEYSPILMRELLGGSLTAYSTENDGAIAGLANVKGNITSSIDVVATSGETADLKTGKYIILATATNKVKVYATLDADFKQGADTNYLDDSLAITDELMITASESTEVDKYGFSIVGKTTVNMTPGDTAEFYVRKVNTGGFELLFGEATTTFSEFGLIACSPRMSDGTITYIELYKCKGAGMPISFKEKVWSEFQCTLKAYYDSERGAVGRFRRIYG